MKKADLRHTFSCIFFTALLSISSIGCLSTAFDFSLNFRQAVGLSLLFAAAVCLLLRSIRTGWLMIPLLLLAGQQLWKAGLAAHTEAFLWYISVMLDEAYDVGYIIWWTHDDHLGLDTTALFMALGILICLVTGWGLVRRRSRPGITAGIAALVPCLLIPGLTPAPFWLLLQLGILITLCITKRVRRHDPAHRGKLELQAALAAGLVLCLLLTLLPPGRYDPPPTPDLLAWFQQLQSMLQPTEPLDPTDPPADTRPGNSGFYTPKKVNLNRVGSKTFSYRYAFELQCSENGWQYLRKASYTTYTGTSWLAYQEEDVLSADPMFLQEGSYSVQIDTYTARKERYTPYYCEDLRLSDGTVPNADNAIAYEYVYRPLLPQWQSLWRETYGGPVSAQQWDVPAHYLELPESTRSGAYEYLEQIGISDSMDVIEVAQKIGAFVQSSASYNLRTGRMPSSREDFVLWFLEESETGYCIHFATAATVLLRSAGIPARYVEGYMVKTGMGLERTVYQGNAHAWVEYYLPGLGWTLLEVTPGDSEPEPSTEPSTRPSIPSTEPSTQPTRPSPRPTVPSETPTAPSAPTVPGGSSSGTPIDLTWLMQVLKVLAWVIGIPALLILQWKLRVFHLCRRLHRGSPNAQALVRWRHTAWLAKLRRQAPPDDLLFLANKAKFSQHSLTHQELGQFDQYRAETVALLRQRNWLLQFVYRIVLAVY